MIDWWSTVWDWSWVKFRGAPVTGEWAFSLSKRIWEWLLNLQSCAASWGTWGSFCFTFAHFRSSIKHGCTWALLESCRAGLCFCLLRDREGASQSGVSVLFSKLRHCCLWIGADDGASQRAAVCIRWTSEYKMHSLWHKAKLINISVVSIDFSKIRWCNYILHPLSRHILDSAFWFLEHPTVCCGCIIV